MKVIYMGTTLGLIHEIHPETAQQILAQGEVKETENNLKYIVINEDI